MLLCKRPLRKKYVFPVPPLNVSKYCFVFHLSSTDINNHLTFWQHVFQVRSLRVPRSLSLLLSRNVIRHHDKMSLHSSLLKSRSSKPKRSGNMTSFNKWYTTAYTHGWSPFLKSRHCIWSASGLQHSSGFNIMKLYLQSSWHLIQCTFLFLDKWRVDSFAECFPRKANGDSDFI